eukprot:s52_g46.t1
MNDDAFQSRVLQKIHHNGQSADAVISVSDGNEKDGFIQHDHVFWFARILWIKQSEAFQLPVAIVSQSRHPDILRRHDCGTAESLGKTCRRKARANLGYPLG